MTATIVVAIQIAVLTSIVLPMTVVIYFALSCVCIITRDRACHCHQYESMVNSESVFVLQVAGVE